MTADADIIEALRDAGLAGEGDVVLEPLTGGVSCDVWKVESLAGPIVVKRPLPQLRVAAEWHINADEPDDAGYADRNIPGPWRSSDHDPLLLGFDL